MLVHVPAVVANSEFRLERGERRLADVTFESCSFDNCHIQGGSLTNVHFVNARTWACGVTDAVLRDCTIDGLRMSLGGSSSGGRTMPLFMDGVLAERVTMRGRIGSLIWNPPKSKGTSIRRARKFYERVSDFALDISAAEFTAIPSLRYGPPGHLVVRDPDTQPLVEMADAQRLLASDDPHLGVWRIVLEDMITLGWPESVVLVPAAKAPKRQRDRDVAALTHLMSRLAQE